MIPALLALLGALGVGTLAVRPERLPRLAALAGVAGAVAGLAVWRVGGHKLEHAATRHPALAATGLAMALVGFGVGTWLLVRWPGLLAFAALAAAPLRVPIHIGDQQAFLLVLLYGVIACAWGAMAYELVRGRPQALLGDTLGLPLAAVLVVGGASLWWSADTLQGVTTTLFFLLPFGLLAVALARLEPTRQLFALLGAELVALALAFALIGAVQAVTHRTAWHNPKLEISNTYAPFFRVNSIFYDPSVYGRFLAVAIVVAVAALLVGGLGRPLVVAVVVALLWGGLALSYSQSSLVALAAGLVACAALVWRRPVLLGVAAGALVLLLAVLVAPQFSSLRHDVRRGDLGKVTSDRSTLATTGLRLFRDHPLQGVGLGGFLQAAQPKRNANARGAKGASHIMPLTVAAENGVLGLATLAWLLVALARLVLERSEGPVGRGIRLALGLALLTILVHSLFYAAFFEDPLTWLLFALLAVAARPAATRAGMIRAA